jgi:hypothetical protein
VALVVLPFVAANAKYLFAPSTHEIARRLYGLNPLPESIVIADYIAERSEPEDSVFVVGSEPQIPFLAERRSATRYILFYPLTGSYPDVLERQREVMAEVSVRRPLYVVWTDVPTSLLIDARSERWLFDEVARLIRREYRLELAVHPTPRGEDYVVALGTDALRWAAQGKPANPGAPWIGVYRRTSR